MSADRKPPVVFLEGEHLYLRPLELSDLDRCHRWINDPQTRLPLGSFLPASEKAEREYIENATGTQDNIQFAIVLKDGDRHIGGTGLHDVRWKDRAAVFGLLIGEKDFRGKGYGGEATRLMLRYAFETLNLNRVELWVFASNQPAIRAYEKSGYVREGIRREYSFIEGKYVDSFVYSILAREYFADRAGGTL